MVARKKKSKCPSCGSPFLKGHYVHRITTDGVVRQRVCKGCTSLAALVLASDAPARCQNGKCRNLAAYCAGCIGELIGPNVAFQLQRSRRRGSTDGDGEMVS